MPQFDPPSAEDDPDTSIERLTLLARELNYRTKHDLQLVAVLLDMQARRAPPEAKGALLEARRRVAAVLGVHQDLRFPRNVTSVDLRGYLTRICRGIEQSCRRPDIHLSLDVEEMMAPAAFALPVGLIVSELVTIGYESASSDQESGAIAVSLKRGDDGAALTIALSRITPILPEGSLGMVLVRGLAGQLEGDLAVTLKSDGATFRMVPSKTVRSSE